jgi:hypothetical protein
LAVRDELERVADRTRRLLDAVRQVTLEEFRTEDAHFERDSRLGRELLYLTSNNQWCRRTTEIVDISQVQAVDTDVVVDVDLGYVDHEAFQPEEGVVWLPLLALPGLMPTHRRRGTPPASNPEPITSLDVSDAVGARVTKLPQAEVHQRLAAALSEIVLNVMANRPEQAETGIGGEVDRDQKLLLSAAIRRMLPGTTAPDHGTHVRPVPAGIGNARARLDAALSRDLETAWAAVAQAEAQEAQPAQVPGQGQAPAAETGVSQASAESRQGAQQQARQDAQEAALTYGDDTGGGPPRPVMGSQVGEILDALIGTVFVVVAVHQVEGPVSYTVHIPSRRLRRFGDEWRRFQPRARLSIDLLAPTTHADRQVKLLLPDGIACLDAERAGDSRTLARIDVILPGPFERLQTLMGRLFPPTLEPDRPVSWVDARIADMALHKVDAALDSLRHYEVASVGDDPPPPTRAGNLEALTEATEEKLRRLRANLAVVRQAGPRTPSTPPVDDAWGDEPGPMAQLFACWDRGSWYPATMRRRLMVNTASPGAVLFRATAIEDVGQRARPTRAQIDADVAVVDSPLFNVARYAGSLNVAVLLAVSVMLFFAHPKNDDELQRELLATILTLFSAVQASRVEHPDTSTLRGLLSRANYLMMQASIIPTVLLAVALAVVPAWYAEWAALAALIAQVLLFLRLRMGPLAGSLRRAPILTLATQFGPDHARADVLRGRRSRDLVAEALRLDREAFAYVVTSAAGQGQFEGLLEQSQRVPERRTDDRLGRVTARAARALTAAGIELGRVSAADGDVVPRDAANLLGVVQSATAGRAMTYLVFRERPAGHWEAGDGTNGGAGAAGGAGAGQPARRTAGVHPVPFDPDRLAPREPPEWMLEVVVGIPETPVVMPLADHPLRTLLAATARSNFTVVSVQLPAPPPSVVPDDEPRRWLRLRVAVPYRRGDSLRGLGSLLYRVQKLDGMPYGDGTLVADVGVSPDRPIATGERIAMTDRDFDVVPDAEAEADPERRWRTLAICGSARTGLLRDILGRLADERPTFALAGVVAAIVHGQTVVFVLGRDTGAQDRSLAAKLPGRLRPGDRATVVVDDWQAARTLDGTPTDDRLLLRVSIRTPDRPGGLRRILTHLQAALAQHAPPGVAVTGLDVWFVLLQVVDGRSTRGRLTIRLPGTRAHWAGWEAVNWATVGRDVGRAAVAAGEREAGSAQYGVPGPGPLLDDVVVTVDLLRTTARLPAHTAPLVQLAPQPESPEGAGQVLGG